MEGWTNPYEVLGTTRAASLGGVREAYHAAVLRCHPDRRPGDPNAQAAFERIVEAYRTILRWRGQDDAGEAHLPGPAVSPAQLARRVQDTVHGGGWGYVESSFPVGPWHRRTFRPAHDEPVVFLALWLAALLAGLVVELVLAGRLPANLDGRADVLSAAALVSAPLAVYGVVLALAVAVPVLTRKTIYLVMCFTHALHKALPAPHHAGLPRGPKPRLS
ncbi:MAG: J domain-containing protein [Planctomycetota bacterium]|nr:J domain-containing protein [Planctomycetota bacterium]